MEFKYKKEMDKHGLTLKDLPEDALTGIEQITAVQKAIVMLEKSGKKVNPKTLKKLNALDKWVTYEIFDMLNDTDENDDEAEFEADEIIEEIEAELDEDEDEDEVVIIPAPIVPLPPAVSADEAKGMLIDAELAELYSSGQRSFEIESLKNSTPKVYDLLFDTYEDGAENGIETSNYSLLEINKLFILKKL